MSKMKIAILGVACSVVLPFATAQAATALKTQKDKASYAIGVDMARKFKAQELDVNTEVMFQGFRDQMAGGEKALSDKEIKNAFRRMQREMVEKRIQKLQDTAKAKAAEGEKFLAANKAKPGVKETKSGLQYRVIKAGKGSKPSPTDRVTVEYTGKTIAGKVFDSTKKQGRPVTFQLNRVIPGWQEALQLMSPGAEYEVFIPSKLAYGIRGAGPMIGPNETLIFNIRLLKIGAKAKGQPRQSR